jgi:hypothetical protein
MRENFDKRNMQARQERKTIQSNLLQGWPLIYEGGRYAFVLSALYILLTASQSASHLGPGWQRPELNNLDILRRLLTAVMAQETNRDLTLYIPEGKSKCVFELSTDLTKRTN